MPKKTRKAHPSHRTRTRKSGGGVQIQYWTEKVQNNETRSIYITAGGKKIYEIFEQVFKKTDDPEYTTVYRLKKKDGKYVRDKKIFNMPFGAGSNRSNSRLIKKDRRSNKYYYIGHKVYLFGTIDNDYIANALQEYIDSSNTAYPFAIGENNLYFFREAVAVPRRLFHIPEGHLPPLGSMAPEHAKDIYMQFGKIGTESRIPLKMEILDDGLGEDLKGTTGDLKKATEDLKGSWFDVLKKYL